MNAQGSLSVVEKTGIVRSWKPETIAHVYAFRVPLCLRYSSMSPVPPISDKPEYLSTLYLVFPLLFQFRYTSSLCTFHVANRGLLENLLPFNHLRPVDLHFLRGSLWRVLFYELRFFNCTLRSEFIGNFWNFL